MRPPITPRFGAPQFSVSETTVASDSSLRMTTPHAVEREVHRRLLAHPGIKLQSLVVRKTPAGVCLEGRAEVLEPELDLSAVLTDIEGVDEVINHLMPSTCCVSPDASHVLFDDEEELALGYHRG
jgi:hypothetical protein